MISSVHWEPFSHTLIYLYVTIEIMLTILLNCLLHVWLHYIQLYSGWMPNRSQNCKFKNLIKIIHWIEDTKLQYLFQTKQSNPIILMNIMNYGVHMYQLWKRHLKMSIFEIMEWDSRVCLVLVRRNADMHCWYIHSYEIDKVCFGFVWSMNAVCYFWYAE